LPLVCSLRVVNNCNRERREEHGEIVGEMSSVARPGYVWSCMGLLCLSALPAGDPVPLPTDTLPNLSVDAIPLGLERNRLIPRDNPLTDAKVQLGRRLFFDPILSADGTVSCASCHDPGHGFAGRERFAVGIRGQRGTRNVPSLLNRAYGAAFFWDGREATLEAQALRPIESAQEMGASVAGAVTRLRGHKEYPSLFRAEFADGVTAENLAKAIASFERVLLVGDSRVDRFRAGDLRTLNDRER